MSEHNMITHSELIELGRKWLIKPYAASAPYGHSDCSVVLTELSTAQWETPDVLGFHNKGSILIECKTSLADFRADQKKPCREHPAVGVGCQRWYLAPAGIIPKNKMPPKWGLLEVTPDRLILPVIKSELHENNKSGEIRILLSVFRRLNVMPDGHVSIKKYTPLENGRFAPSKKKATFYIEGENHENNP